ncbi:microtubule-associated protein futsch [Nematostella vectensis]|uniref:microtubule-associated protein futsch n=1 Tax=Nematostella vectensis TaxID=45351 RepID=UPI002077112A|nr:microtubule-associated protein futsch [Nematostella vectensis]
MAVEENHSRRKDDRSLDFLSANFDPLRALYRRDIQPPFPNIQVFNNLAEYARAIKEGKSKPAFRPSEKPQPSQRARNLKPQFQGLEIQERLQALADGSTKVEGQGGAVLASAEGGVCLGGKVVGGGGLGEGRRWKKPMNVLDKMQACSVGPMSILYRCVEERLKLRVWTRRYKGLRSVLSGYLIAFDKHMNLALMDVDEVYTLEEITAEPLPEAEAKEVKQKKKKKKKNKKGPESLNECRKEESELLKAVAPPEKNVASTDVSKVQEEESEMESTVKDSHLYQRTSIDELFMEYRDPRLLRRTDKACEIGTAMSSIRVQSERKPVVELPTDPRIQKGIPSNVKPLVGDNKQASDCHLKDKINLIGKQIPADPRIRPRPDSQGKVDSVKPFVEETVHAGITQLQEDRRQMQKQPLAVDPRTRPSLESQEQEDSNVEPVSEKVQVDIRRQMQKQPLAVDPRLQPRPQSQEQVDSNVVPLVGETVQLDIRRQMQKQPLAVDPRTRPSFESQKQEESNVEPSVGGTVQVDIRRQMQKQPLAVDRRLQPRPQSQEQVDSNVVPPVGETVQVDIRQQMQKQPLAVDRRNRPILDSQGQASGSERVRIASSEIAMKGRAPDLATSATAIHVRRPFAGDFPSSTRVEKGKSCEEAACPAITQDQVSSLDASEYSKLRERRTSGNVAIAQVISEERSSQDPINIPMVQERSHFTSVPSTRERHLFLDAARIRGRRHSGDLASAQVISETLSSRNSSSVPIVRERSHSTGANRTHERHLSFDEARMRDLSRTRRIPLAVISDLPQLDPRLSTHENSIYKTDSKLKTFRVLNYGAKSREDVDFKVSYSDSGTNSAFSERNEPQEQYPERKAMAGEKAWDSKTIQDSQDVGSTATDTEKTGTVPFSERHTGNLETSMYSTQSGTVKPEGIDDDVPALAVCSEKPSFLFSQDLTVHLSSCDEGEPEEMEFTVVGIFQPNEPNPGEQGLVMQDVKIQIPLVLPQTDKQMDFMEAHVPVVATVSDEVFSDLDDIVMTTDKDGINTARDPNDSVMAPDPDDTVTAPDPEDFNTAPAPEDFNTAPDLDDFDTAPDLDDFNTAYDPDDIVMASDPDDINTARDPDDIVTASDPDDVNTASDPDDIKTASDPDDIAMASGTGTKKKDIIPKGSSAVTNADNVVAKDCSMVTEDNVAKAVDVVAKESSLVTKADDVAKDISTVTKADDIVAKESSFVTKADDVAKDISTVTKADDVAKDISMVTKADDVAKDSSTVTKADDVAKDSSTVTKADDVAKDISTVTKADDVTKDISTVTNSDDVANDISTVTKADDVAKDSSTVTKADDDAKDISTVTKADDVAKDISTVTNSDDVAKDISTVTKADDVAKDMSTVTKADDVAKDISTVTKADDVAKDSSTVTKADDVAKDSSTVTKADDVAKDSSTVTKADDVAKDISTVTKADDVAKDISTVTKADDVAKDISTVTKADDVAKDISAVTNSDDVAKDISTVTKADDVAKDISTVTKADDVAKDISTVTKADNVAKDISTVTKADDVAKDISTVTKADDVAKDISTVTKADDVAKDISTVTKADDVAKDISTVTKADDVAKDSSTVTKADDVAKDSSTVTKADDVAKDSSTVTKADDVAKDISTVTKADDVAKDMSTVTNSDDVAKDISTVTNSDDVAKDISTVTNSDDVAKDISTVTKADDVAKDVSTVTKADDVAKDISTVTKADDVAKDISTVTKADDVAKDSSTVTKADDVAKDISTVTKADDVAKDSSTVTKADDVAKDISTVTKADDVAKDISTVTNSDDVAKDISTVTKADDVAKDISTVTKADDVVAKESSLVTEAEVVKDSNLASEKGGIGPIGINTMEINPDMSLEQGELSDSDDNIAQKSYITPVAGNPSAGRDRNTVLEEGKLSKGGARPADRMKLGVKALSQSDDGKEEGEISSDEEPPASSGELEPTGSKSQCAMQADIKKHTKGVVPRKGPVWARLDFSKRVSIDTRRLEQVEKSRVGEEDVPFESIKDSRRRKKKPHDKKEGKGPSGNGERDTSTTEIGDVTTRHTQSMKHTQDKRRESSQIKEKHRTEDTFPKEKEARGANANEISKQGVKEKARETRRESVRQEGKDYSKDLEGDSKERVGQNAGDAKSRHESRRESSEEGREIGKKDSRERQGDSNADVWLSESRRDGRNSEDGQRKRERVRKGRDVSAKASSKIPVNEKEYVGKARTLEESKEKARNIDTRDSKRSDGGGEMRTKGDCQGSNRGVKGGQSEKESKDRTKDKYSDSRKQPDRENRRERKYEAGKLGDLRKGEKLFSSELNVQNSEKVDTKISQTKGKEQYEDLSENLFLSVETREKGETSRKRVTKKGTENSADDSSSAPKGTSEKPRQLKDRKDSEQKTGCPDSDDVLAPHGSDNPAVSNSGQKSARKGLLPTPVNWGRPQRDSSTDAEGLVKDLEGITTFVPRLEPTQEDCPVKEVLGSAQKVSQRRTKLARKTLAKRTAKPEFSPSKGLIQSNRKRKQRDQDERNTKKVKLSAVSSRLLGWQSDQEAAIKVVENSTEQMDRPNTQNEQVVGSNTHTEQKAGLNTRYKPVAASKTTELITESKTRKEQITGSKTRTEQIAESDTRTKPLAGSNTPIDNDKESDCRTVKIGKGKRLVFKRRHVNQLFVRGDNVVMVAFAP